MSNHLTRREILLYVDGELSLWRSWRIQAHVRSCWNCRRELERLEADIRAIVDAQNRSFLPAMPRPVRAWDNFEELAASLPPARRLRLGVLSRQAAKLVNSNLPSALRWATAVVTLICVVITVLWLLPERLSAQIVLHRMEQAERIRTSTNSGQVLHQRVRIGWIDRRSSARKSVEIESWGSGARSVWMGNVGELEARYRSVGLASSLPISTAATERWLQETLAEPRVSSIGRGVELEARNMREGGDLQSVLVRVHTGTWRLESMRLTFADMIFDVAEVDLSILKKSQLPSILLAELEPEATPEMNPLGFRSAPPDPHAEPVPPASSPIEEELEVQFRLHEVGADLGEPIELKQDQGKVVISARSASEERKRQLAQMFGGDSGIRLETEVGPMVLVPADPPSLLPRAALEPRQNEQLLEFFGSAEAQENFTRAILDADGTVLARLYALRSLARHWPSNIEPMLSAEGRRGLHAMVNDHLHALHTSQVELSQLFDPFLERLCGPGADSSGNSSSHADWREPASAGLEAARTLDRNLRALLTTSANRRTVTEACPELKSALLALSSSLRSMPPEL
jgi:hypothetical protein